MSQKLTTVFQDSHIFDGLYEIVGHPVGRGSNSVVYQARSLQQSAPRSITREFSALKVLMGTEKDPASHLRKMKREAVAMLSCLHRNVVKLTDYVIKGELNYFVMEFAERGDLKDILDKQRMVFSPDLVLRLMVQVLSGMEQIHRVGLIHRDIKPENLLLTKDCIVKIADFGLACLPHEQDSLDESNRGAGTFDYLAPEMLAEGIGSQASDVYSAAVTCYELITGNLPFTGASLAEQINNKMSAQIIPLEKFLKPVPYLLQEFLAKALAPDPETRFNKAVEFRKALEAYLEGKWEPDEKPMRRERNLVDAKGDGKALADQAVPIGDNNQNNVTGVCLSSPSIDMADNAKKDFSFSDWSAHEDRAESEIIEINDQRNDKEEFKIPDFDHPAQQELEGGLGQKLRACFYPLFEVLKQKRKLVIACCTLVFVASFWYFASPTHRNIEGRKDSFATQDLIPSEATASTFAALLDKSKVGVLRGLFGSDEDLSFALVPLGNSGQVLVVLSLPAWQPVTVNLGQMNSPAEIVFSGGGVRLKMTIDSNADVPQLGVKGVFVEENSGRSGEWLIW